MQEPISFEEIDASLTSTMEETEGMPVPEETPFRVALLGDFSGRRNRGVFQTGSTLAKRRFIFVDRDNIDEAMEKLGVGINLPIFGKNAPPVHVTFSKMDDFHPDSLFNGLDVFQALRDTRRGLKDPATFALLAGKFRSEDKEAPPPLTGGGEGAGDLLEQILDEAEGEKTVTEPPLRASEMDSFLKEIVKPHLVPDTGKEQARMLASVDAAAGELMRIIMRHPDFQALEAAWRALYFLISRLETGEKLKLYLLDISKEELAADLNETDDLRKTGIYRLLVEQTVETFGGEPWALIAGNYTFDYTKEDAGLLGRIAKVAAKAGAPFISAAHSYLIGCESLARTPYPEDWKRSPGSESRGAWQTLRKSPAASYIGLALPRFLLRLPYGKDTEPAESFAFEEMPVTPEHEHYLWGNPSFACAYLIAMAFIDYGWSIQPGMLQTVEGLPLHIYKENGESKITPCAEALFTEEAVDVILGKGIMPLISFKNQDRVRLARLQSIAEPPTSLAGRWD